MADCWNLKNTNPGATRPAMMMIRAQSSSEPEILSNPTELDRPADKYTPFISKGVIQDLGSSESIPIMGHWSKSVLGLTVRKQITPVRSDFCRC